MHPSASFSAMIRVRIENHPGAFAVAEAAEAAGVARRALHSPEEADCMIDVGHDEQARPVPLRPRPCRTR